MRLFAELMDLVLPNVCVCCGQPSTDQWCGACREPARVRRCAWPGTAGPPIEVWSAADYAGGVRQALLAYKERGQRRLARPLAQLLAAAVRSAAGSASVESAWPVVLVPVPSSAGAARERGGDHMLRLADTMGRLQLIESAPGWQMAPVLRLRGRSQDSVGLSASERAAREAGVRALPPTGSQALSEAVILDDIATTGATIAECAQALQTAGWQVRAAAVVAHTRLRRG